MEDFLEIQFWKIAIIVLVTVIITGGFYSLSKIPPTMNDATRCRNLGGVPTINFWGELTECRKLEVK